MTLQKDLTVVRSRNEEGAFRHAAIDEGEAN